MPDDLRQLRDQVLQRLRHWRQTGVPRGKYAVLLARTYHVVLSSVIHDVHVRGYYAPALLRRLTVTTDLWWSGGRLSRTEVDSAAQLADLVVEAHTAGDQVAVPTWFAQAIPCYAGCLRTALTEPRQAVADLISGMEPAGRPWADRQASWLRTFLHLTDCLHLSQAAVIDPRWRTADTLGLARGIVEDRADDRLPLLADALLDAGCGDDFILAHCKSGGRHPPECWALDLFGLRERSPCRPDGGSGATAGPTGRTAPAPGRHRRVTEGMAAIARLAGATHPNLVAFARTGTLRDEAHRTAVRAELAALAASVGSDTEARPLTRLLEIMPSAPVGVCVH